jgi:hypothetical protein
LSSGSSERMGRPRRLIPSPSPPPRREAYTTNSALMAFDLSPRRTGRFWRRALGPQRLGTVASASADSPVRPMGRGAGCGKDAAASRQAARCGQTNFERAFSSAPGHSRAPRPDRLRAAEDHGTAIQKTAERTRISAATRRSPARLEIFHRDLKQPAASQPFSPRPKTIRRDSIFFTATQRQVAAENFLHCDSSRFTATRNFPLRLKTVRCDLKPFTATQDQVAAENFLRCDSGRFAATRSFSLRPRTVHCDLKPFTAT